MRPAILAILALFLIFPGLAVPARAAELQSFPGCQLVDQPWADGDSFAVRFPDGKVTTVRLYGADCMEIHLDGDDSNARRLRDQRRHFGIADIQKAKAHGEKARDHVVAALAGPFTVHTAFADGRGDGRFQRVYGFVTTAAGRDLAGELVSLGLARAFGVTRLTHDGTTGKEYLARLQDLELAAAKLGRGAWADTDWSRLPEDRRLAREEEAEIDLAKGEAAPPTALNPNTAARDELMRLPGIGEVLANRIIESRARAPFARPDDMLAVEGIGPALLAKLHPFLKF